MKWVVIRDFYWLCLSQKCQNVITSPTILVIYMYIIRLEITLFAYFLVVLNYFLFDTSSFSYAGNLINQKTSPFFFWLLMHMFQFYFPVSFIFIFANYISFNITCNLQYYNLFDMIYILFLYSSKILSLSETEKFL